jgi:hypothetical protein
MVYEVFLRDATAGRKTVTTLFGAEQSGSSRGQKCHMNR